MSSFPQVFHPVSSDRALEFLTNSMWSTMMITGVFFMSFLFVFLSIRVGRSVGIESLETGPIQISFLFSISGIRYIYNHVRHHLFETPLMPRRRFSSLSISWFSELLKRASFSSKNKYNFTEEISTISGDKSRRNSTHSEHNSSRRSSTSSKSKRMSVPHIHGNKNNSSTGPTTTNTQQNTEKRTNTSDQLFSRRNTLPNIAISSESPKVNLEIRLISETLLEETLTIRDEAKIITEAPVNNTLNVIIEEEEAENANIHEDVQIKEQESQLVVSNLMPAIEEECIETDGNESSFGELITDDSDDLISEEESVDQKDAFEEEKEAVSESINIPKSSFQSQSSFESSSPKASSFRSSYFNYLPESIFGYPTGISKTVPAPISPPLDSHNLNAPPPGFSKRAVSHDFTNTSSLPCSNEPTDEFNKHQPLYARRRTETSSRIFSDAAKSFLPAEWAVKFQSFERVVDEDDNRAPIRTNTSSPCLIDLQNTEDLFAPINWNFSSTKQNEDLRRNWDIIEDTDPTPVPEPVESSKNPTSRRLSTSFSSLFD